MSKQRPNVLRLLSHMLAAVFNNPSAFHQQWKAQSSRAGDPLAGRWVGEWRSDDSGHGGELKCLFSPGGPGVYNAFFYARFSKLFRVGYVTRMHVKPAGSGLQLHAEENLGALAGGTYRCDGKVEGRHFTCTYDCKYDHGLFTLDRVS